MRMFYPVSPDPGPGRLAWSRLEMGKLRQMGPQEALAPARRGHVLWEVIVPGSAWCPLPLFPGLPSTDGYLGAHPYSAAIFPSPPSLPTYTYLFVCVGMQA